MSLKLILIFGFMGLLISGCGVKGDPVPPTKPPHLGRGQPTFKDAVKEIKPVPIKSNPKKDEDENEQ